jgi:hypothetical protein
VCVCILLGTTHNLFFVPALIGELNKMFDTCLFCLYESHDFTPEKCILGRGYGLSATAQSYSEQRKSYQHHFRLNVAPRNEVSHLFLVGFFPSFLNLTGNSSFQRSSLPEGEHPRSATTDQMPGC